MRRHVVVSDQVYKTRLHFWRGPEQAMVTFVRRDGEECDLHHGLARTVCYASGDRFHGRFNIHIWIAPEAPLSTPEGVAALAHEAVHVANVVFARIGATPTHTWNDDEPYAYYVEWIVREFMRRMR